MAADEGVAGTPGVFKKPPQVERSLQTLQSTPRLLVSFTETAIKFTVAGDAGLVTGSWLGANGTKETNGTGVTFTATGSPDPGAAPMAGTSGGAVSEAVEVAVKMTVGFCVHGCELGAINVTAAPLALCAGVKVPQLVLPPKQLADQSSPAFVVSPVTTALKLAG
jgi:hypothetical protein